MELLQPKLPANDNEIVKSLQEKICSGVSEKLTH